MGQLLLGSVLFDFSLSLRSIFVASFAAFLVAFFSSFASFRLLGLKPRNST